MALRKSPKKLCEASLKFRAMSVQCLALFWRTDIKALLRFIIQVASPLASRLRMKHMFQHSFIRKLVKTAAESACIYSERHKVVDLKLQTSFAKYMPKLFLKSLKVQFNTWSTLPVVINVPVHFYISRMTLLI